MFIEIKGKNFFFDAENLQRLNDLLEDCPQGKYSYKTETVAIDKDAKRVRLVAVQTTEWQA